MDVKEQRVRFVVAALRRERSLSILCREFVISRPTGRLWVERYRIGGVEAIAERSRRPLHSPQRTASAGEERVVAMRLRYPDWGARKLRCVLGKEGLDLARQHHPSHSSAPRSGAGGGPAPERRTTLRTRRSQRTVADGL